MPIRCLAILLIATLLAATRPAAAHGGVVEEDDLCVINIGYLKAHFKIYVPQKTGHQEYCEDIPVRGEAVFVMEYQHDSLGSSLVDFRIVENTTGKGTFARLADVEATDDINAISLKYEAAAIRPDVFTVLHDFAADGEYIGIVSAKQPDNGKTYTAVFPFEVGYTGFGIWPYVIVGAIFLQLNYWFMNRRRRVSGATATTICLCLSLIPATGSADETGCTDSKRGLFSMCFVVDDGTLAELPLNRIHQWQFTLRNAQGLLQSNATITVSGGMPAHDHGLPTAPRALETEVAGHYAIFGMRFHMRGEWVLQFDIEHNGKRDTVLLPLVL